MNIVIIGYGYVGKAYHKVFPEAFVYDYYGYSEITPPRNERLDRERLLQEGKLATREGVNQCDMAIICVPTPSLEDGACNISAIEETFRWLKVKNVLIKSTITPGTTEKLQEKYPDLNIAFSPEYIGEGNYYLPPQYPDPKDPSKHDFFIVGGNNTDFFVYVFLRKNPQLKTLQVSSKVAETIKYMVNTWIATKVSFINEMYEACNALGIPFTQVREGWLMDSRIERTFSAIFPGKRGYDGKCIPKDVNALIASLIKHGYNPELFNQVVKSNEQYRREKTR